MGTYPQGRVTNHENEATLDPQVKFSISELKSNVHKFPGNFLRDVEFLKKNLNPSFGEGGFNLSHLNPPIPKEKKIWASWLQRIYVPNCVHRPFLLTLIPLTMIIWVNTFHSLNLGVNLLPTK